MRRSMKKVAATLFTTAMTMGFATLAYGADIVPSKIPDGQTVFTVTGNMTNPAWASMDEANVMKDSDGDGILEFKVTMPAYNEESKWMSRFTICAYDNQCVLESPWNRIALGNPQITPNTTMMAGKTCLSTIRVECEQETECTVLFNPATYGVAIVDANGMPVDFEIGLVTNDDDEPFHCVNDFAVVEGVSKVTQESLEAEVSADRKADITELGVKVTDLKALENETIKKQYTLNCSDIKEGETVFTLTGNMTSPGWASKDERNVLKDTDGDGLLEMEITMPAYDEESKWMSRFTICGYNNKCVLESDWNRIALGNPEIAPETIMMAGKTCLSTIRVACAEETKCKVLFDPKTYGVAIVDENDNEVPFSVGLVTNDDDEIYYNIADFGPTQDEPAKVNQEVLYEGLSADRQKDFDELGIKVVDLNSLKNRVLNQYNNFSVSEIKKGETVFTLTGNMSPKAWASKGRKNVMKDTDGDGLLEMKITMPAYDEESKWMSRFTICGYNNDCVLDSDWNRIVLGNPEIKPETIMMAGKTCLSTIRVACAEETECTVLFDPKTYGVAIIDNNDNEVPFQVGLVTNDDDETYYDVADFGGTAEAPAKVNQEILYEGLSADRKADFDALGVKVVDLNSAKNAVLNKHFNIVAENIKEGETLFTVTGNMTNPAWSSQAKKNIMKDTNDDGILEFDVTMPAYDEESKWMSRFTICAYNNKCVLDSAWNRIVLGNPQIKPETIMMQGKTCLSTIRIECAEETKCKVLFDPDTYGVAVVDENGDFVPFKVGLVTNDDDELFYSVEEFETLTKDAFIADLSADRKADAAALGVEVPNLVALRQTVMDKVNGKYVNKDQVLNIAKNKVTKTIGVPAFDPVKEFGIEASDNVVYKIANSNVLKYSTAAKKFIIKGVGTTKVTVTVPGKRWYNAVTKEITVVVNAKTQTITGTSNFTKKIGDKAFSLGAKATGSPKMTYVSSNKNVATVDSKGKVTLKGVGTATITVKAEAKGNYKAASKKVKVVVNPQKATITKVVGGSKKITVTFKKDSKVNSYVVKYATNSSFKGAKTKTVKTNSAVITGLKANTKYYVQVKAVKKTSASTYNGAYSATKTVKTLKK